MSGGGQQGEIPAPAAAPPKVNLGLRGLYLQQHLLQVGGGLQEPLVAAHGQDGAADTVRGRSGGGDASGELRALLPRPRVRVNRTRTALHCASMQSCWSNAEVVYG